MQKTRQQILAYLGQNQAATCLDMSRAFGFTPANVRHHLGILEAQGLVQHIGERKPPGRGRPEIVYALAVGQSNPALTGLLRQLLGGKRNKSKIRMRTLAQGIFGLEEEPGGSQTQRLMEIVQRFEPLGYQPTWEATPSGPQIHLHRCPFAEIIADHPELCRMDAAAMESLLSQQIHQSRKLEPDTEGLPRCTFVLESGPTQTV